MQISTVLYIAFFILAALWLICLIKNIISTFKRNHTGDSYTKKNILQTLFARQNLEYLILSFLMAVSVNVIGRLTSYAAAGTTVVPLLDYVAGSVQNAAEMYAFIYNSEIFNSSPLFVTVYISSAAFCAISLIITILRTAFSQWLNDAFVRKMLRSGCDVVVGNNEKALKYVKNNRENTILWVPFDKSRDDDFSADKYRRLGIIYYHAPFNLAELTQFLHLKKIFPYTNIHFFFFEGNDFNILNVSEIFSKLTCRSAKKQDKIRIYAHIEVGNEIEPFAKYDLINHNEKDDEKDDTAAPGNTAATPGKEVQAPGKEAQSSGNKSNLPEKKKEKVRTFPVKVLSDTFNTYTSIANEFILNYPMIETLREKFTVSNNGRMENEFIDGNGALRQDHNINVIFLGYGKVNSAIFRKVMENYQLCSYYREKDIYHAHPLRFDIYDNNSEKLEDDSLIQRLKDYGNFCTDADLPTSDELKRRHKEFFGDTKINRKPEWKNDEKYRIEMPCILETRVEEYPSDNIKNTITARAKEKNCFTMIFVGIENDMNNYRHAQEIVHFLKKENVDMKRVQVFCNFDEINSGTLGDHPSNKNSIILYGSKNILTHRDAITRRDVAIMSGNKNLLYGNNAMIPDSWYESSNFQRESSIASTMNICFKLNLIGLTMKNKAPEEKIITADKYRRFYDFKSTSRNAPDKFKAEANYASYFGQNKKSVICYTEHLRWNAFYFINGFDPEPVEMFGYTYERYKKDKTKGIKKDDENSESFTLQNADQKRKTGFAAEINKSEQEFYNKISEAGNILKKLTKSNPNGKGKVAETDDEKSIKDLMDEVERIEKQILKRCRLNPKNAKALKEIREIRKEIKKIHAFTPKFVIDKKLEDYRFHSCMRNFYGVDALHMYMSEMAEYCAGIDRWKYINRNETYGYDSQSCDDIHKILVQDQDEKNDKKRKKLPPINVLVEIEPKK